MTRRQIQKAIYTSIVKEGKSHQQTFDNLKEENYSDLEGLAKEIVKMPTSGKIEANKSLVYTYIALLALIIILRSLGIVAVLNGMNTPALIGFIVLGMLVPVLGIYGALTHRPQLFLSTSMLLIIALIRGLVSQGANLNIESLLVIAITLGAIVLGFVIPNRFKSAYQKNTEKETIDEKTRTIFIYTFEDTRKGNKHILDQNF